MHKQIGGIYQLICKYILRSATRHKYERNQLAVLSPHAFDANLESDKKVISDEANNKPAPLDDAITQRSVSCASSEYIRWLNCSLFESAI